MYTQAESDISTEALEVDTTFSLREALQVLRKRLWIIVLVAIVLGGLALGLSLIQTPKYEASIRILIGQEQIGEVPAGGLGVEIEGLQKITQTMVEGVDSDAVAEAVIQRLGLQMTPEVLRNNLDVEQVRATQFINVTYEDTNPERAQQIANTVGEVFSEQVSEVSPSANAVTATVWDAAKLPDEPVSPKPLRNGLVALAAGVMLGITLALLLEYLNNSR